jgi:hypothetical protein
MIVRGNATAFPALFRTDNSEAGLALRISFLFWKETEMGHSDVSLAAWRSRWFELRHLAAGHQMSWDELRVAE